MRRLTLALVALSLAFAGCFGDDEEPTTDPTPDTTPTPTVTPTPTGGNGTGDGGNGTTPTPTPEAPPAPEEVYTKAGFNFVRPPPEAPTTEPFTVPDGFSTITLNVTWNVEPAGAPVTVNNGASVTITGPGGSTLTCAAPAGGTAPTEPTVCTETSPNPEAGEWSVAYAGEGSWKADVSVVVS